MRMCLYTMCILSSRALRKISNSANHTSEKSITYSWVLILSQRGVLLGSVSDRIRTGKIYTTHNQFSFFFFFFFCGGVDSSPLLLMSLQTYCTSPGWWWVWSNRWKYWHMTWPGLELGPPRRESGDYPRELRYNQGYQSLPLKSLWQQLHIRVQKVNSITEILIWKSLYWTECKTVGVLSITHEDMWQVAWYWFKH
jgi:hypothetical protein